MSRKRTRRQRNFPWPIVIFAGVLVLVAVFLLANKAGGAGGGGSSTSGTPRIAVDPAKLDYGYVQFGNDKTFKIKVSNTGDGVLRFSEQPYVEVLEGC
jgi:hypothetical protein